MAASSSLNPFNFSPRYKQADGYVFLRDHCDIPRIQQIVVQNASTGTQAVAANDTPQLLALDTYVAASSSLPSSYFVNADDTVLLPHAGYWGVRIDCPGTTSGAGTTIAELTFGIRIGSSGAVVPIGDTVISHNGITSFLIASGTVRIPGGKAWQVVCTNRTGCGVFTVDYDIAGPPAFRFNVSFTYLGE